MKGLCYQAVVPNILYEGLISASWHVTLLEGKVLHITNGVGIY